MKKKKRLRDMSWDDYDISRNRYKELKAFCLQYEEKKSKINRGVSAMSYDSASHSGAAGSQVERQAIENSIYLRHCRMIERAAVQANPEIWKYIVRSVTQDMPYEYIEYDEEQGKIPVGKTDFYAYRKLFYHFLDEMQIGDKLNVIT